MKRKSITLKTKLAAALCELYLTHEEAKGLSEDGVLALVVWDHYPYPHSQGGPDAHWNLVPMFIAAHKVKTDKVDLPQLAKTKRITKKQEEFRARMLASRDERPQPRSKWASRPFPKRSKLNERSHD